MKTMETLLGPGEKMRIRGLGLSLALVLAVAGCQSGAANFQTVRMPSGDYDRTFEVVREVVGGQFTIARADKSTGRIVTNAQAVGEGEDVVGAVINLPNEVRGMRRTVTAQVTASGGTTLVSVKVQLETAESGQAVPRPTYSEYEPTMSGSEGFGFARPEERTGTVWRQAGNDAEMEKKLLTEIERRLKAAGLEAAPANEPTATEK